jgi:hypothetical protein
MMRKLRKPALSRAADGNWEMPENLMAASAEKNAAPLCHDPRPPPDERTRRPRAESGALRKSSIKQAQHHNQPGQRSPVRSNRGRQMRTAMRWLRP